jgi:hypothetical protein
MRRTLNFHFHRVQFDFHFTVARIDVIKRLKIGRRVCYAETTGGAASLWLEAPRRRSLARANWDNGRRSRNAMIPDMAGMGQICPGAFVAVQSDQ